MSVTDTPQTHLEARRDAAAPLRQAQTARLIAGPIPAAEHIADPEIRPALTERAALIEQRAEALVTQATETGEPWLTRLGPPPNHPTLRTQWEQDAATVAAYRDRHGVTDPADPFGQPHGRSQRTRRADRGRAQAAATQARRLALGAIRPQRPAEQRQRAERDLSLDL